eukprot:1419725-Rhodomonas_salina.1
MATASFLDSPWSPLSTPSLASPAPSPPPPSLLPPSLSSSLSPPSLSSLSPSLPRSLSPSLFPSQILQAGQVARGDLNSAISLRRCYVVPGTELAYGATAIYLRTHKLCAARYCASMRGTGRSSAIRLRHMPGTGPARGTTAHVMIDDRLPCTPNGGTTLPPEINAKNRPFQYCSKAAGSCI